MKYLILILLLTGCEYLEDIQWVQRGDKIIVNNTPNITVNVTEEVNESVAFTIEGETYFIAEDTVVYIDEHVYVIDSGSHTAIPILKKFERQPDALIVTLDSPEKIDGVKYLVLSTKPKTVYDNGLPTESRKEYIQYAELLDVKFSMVNTHKKMDELEFFVPFEDRGFLVDDDLNSIVVKVDELLYMSNCYGACQNIVNTTADYVVLAHNGQCPTNDLEFILEVGADKIFGTELCSDFLTDANLNLDELSLLGIEFVEIKGVVSP